MNTTLSATAPVHPAETAVVSTLLHAGNPHEAYDLIMSIAEGRMTDVDELAARLSDLTHTT